MPAAEEIPPSQPLTEQGTILGTYQYMSPEQLEGKDADARSDIFAFGCLLHEMTTGQKAFSGKSRLSLVTGPRARTATAIRRCSPTGGTSNSPPSAAACLTLDRKLMAVEVKAVAGFAAGLPVELFETRAQTVSISSQRAHYAASADGQRFLVNNIVQRANLAPIEVVLNWTAGLKKP